MGVAPALLCCALASATSRADDALACSLTLRAPCPPQPFTFPLPGADRDPHFSHGAGSAGPLPPERRNGPHAGQHPEASGAGNPFGAATAFSPLHAPDARYPWQSGLNNRLRVLSLWTAGASSFSLQAGHGHEATLQWNMPLGSGSSRAGVLDPWFGRAP